MDHKKQVTLLGIVVILILLTEGLVFNRLYFLQKFSHLQQQRMYVEDGELNQFSYQDGVLVSQGIDPRITFSNIDTRVASMSIACDGSIATATGHVFYRNGHQPYSSLSYKPSLDGGTILLAFPGTQFVTDLRIDPTNRQGDVITCQEFVLNPPPRFHLSLTRFILYVCLLVLSVLEIFKSSKHRLGYLLNEWVLQLKSMLEKTTVVFHDKAMLLLPLSWILLWLLPWAVWLNAFPWVRLAISLLLFVFPGMIFSLLLTGTRFTLLGHFSSGVALSVFLVGALGFAARLFHWPFESINKLFALSGLIGILILLKHSASGRSFYKPARLSGRPLILLLFVIAFGIITNLHSRFSVDDLSYVAYLTNWQHAQRLDFREVLYGVGTADSIRFWLGMFPMSMAVLAEISHLHGLLLIGFYIEPFLMLFAILALYVLFSDLLKPEEGAIYALLLHFTFIFLIPPLHRYFFEEISQDKVFAVFVLTPVFVVALRHFLESFHWRSGLFFSLTGLSLALTHPIILAYASFIVAVYAAIETTLRREYKKFATTVILLVILIAPSASLRFIDEAWLTRLFGLTPLVSASDTFHLDTVLETPDINNLISYIEGTPFYGLNVAKIDIALNSPATNPILNFLLRSYLWILGLGFLWSLFNLRKDPTAPFITASSLLVILCSIPYTGWIVGYFVSARLLWRVVWMLPVGLMCFVLLRDFFIALENRMPANSPGKTLKKDALLLWLALGCVLLLGSYSEFFYQYRGAYQGQSTEAEMIGYRNHLARLANLGNYLESHIERPTRFIAPYELMYYLPGLSSKSKAVIFRVKDWTPYPVKAMFIDSILSDDPSIPVKQRLRILNKYQIQYIVMDQPALERYYAGFPNYFELQYTDGYWLFKVLAYQ